MVRGAAAGGAAVSRQRRGDRDHAGNPAQRRAARGAAGRGRTARICMSLRTPLTDLLGIDVPILQSGMSRVAGPELAAEVSKAGGLGILAALRLTAEELRREIR